MDRAFEAQFHAAETCIVCTDAFNATHQPVALPCNHIFGYECIKKWIKDGRGNTNACPTCRHPIVNIPKPPHAFNAPSLWALVCELPPERLQMLILNLWTGIQELWQQNPDGVFSVKELLSRVVIQGLETTGRAQWTPSDDQDTILDCHNFVSSTWNSLGRPDSPSGLAIPFVRLARLMSSASTTLPKWLTTNARTNLLIWKANACLGLTETNIDWRYVMEAAYLEDPQYFPLLQLYTLLVSRSIAHNPDPRKWPQRRHDIMNFVVERCCVKVGSIFSEGRPSNHFKELLVVVYEELRRYQHEKGCEAFKGSQDEEDVVSGVWALAKWGVKQGRLR